MYALIPFFHAGDIIIT